MWEAAGNVFSGLCQLASAAGAINDATQGNPIGAYEWVNFSNMLPQVTSPGLTAKEKKNFENAKSSKRGEKGGEEQDSVKAAQEMEAKRVAAQEAEAKRAAETKAVTAVRIETKEEKQVNSPTPAPQLATATTSILTPGGPSVRDAKTFLETAAEFVPNRPGAFGPQR